MDKHRFKRILLPYYIVIFVFLLLILFTAEFNLSSAVHLATATQGINYLYWPYKNYGAMPGTGHLWYITIILLCFIFTPILDWLYNRYSPSLKQLYIPCINNMRCSASTHLLWNPDFLYNILLNWISNCQRKVCDNK